MGKIWVEVSLVSAHGLGYSPALWKRQWFAVGWIDPNCKYCTKVDASGSENPVWKSKFAIPVDDSEPENNIQDLMLNVEVHSIDPIFLTEKIHGSAPVIIKEFLAKKNPNSEISIRPGDEEVRSYPLRKKDSDKPRGFIDISIRILELKEEQNSNPGINWRGKKRGNLIRENGLGEKHSLLASTRPQQNEARTNIPCSYPMQFPANDFDSNLDEGRPRKERERRRRTPSPPPPPSNAGYIPTFLPRNDSLPSPSSGPNPPGLAMGALIFGDDFMSGFDVPPRRPAL